MDNSIILAGKAHNSRTKGSIAKFLAINQIDHVALGNGSSFTGFILNDDVTYSDLKMIEEFINDWDDIEILGAIFLDFKHEEYVKIKKLKN